MVCYEARDGYTETISIHHVRRPLPAYHQAALHYMKRSIIRLKRVNEPFDGLRAANWMRNVCTVFSRKTSDAIVEGRTHLTASGRCSLNRQTADRHACIRKRTRCRNGLWMSSSEWGRGRDAGATPLRYGTPRDSIAATG
jgi:hypothetical protein